MNHKNNDARFAAIYKIVKRIPKGYVATYGQLAFLAGFAHAPRMAGKALSFSPKHLPCHRVVNSVGRLAPGFTEQRGLLEAEGVGFHKSGHVNLKKHLWNPFLDS